MINKEKEKKKERTENRKRKKQRKRIKKRNIKEKKKNSRTYHVLGPKPKGFGDILLHRTKVLFHNISINGFEHRSQQ